MFICAFLKCLWSENSIYSTGNLLLKVDEVFTSVMGGRKILSKLHLYQQTITPSIDSGKFSLSSTLHQDVNSCTRGTVLSRLKTATGALRWRGVSDLVVPAE